MMALAMCVNRCRVSQKEEPCASSSIAKRAFDVTTEQDAGPPREPWPGPPIGASVLLDV